MLRRLAIIERGVFFADFSPIRYRKMRAILIRPVHAGNPRILPRMDSQTPLCKHGNMGMKNPIAAACIVLTLLVQTSRAADIGDFPQVDRAMQELITNHEIAGAVTLVADKDHILHESAVGQANIENSEAMKPDAIFWIASMTKPVTATAIMILQEEGKLSVNDPVSKYIPELGDLKGPDGKPRVVLLKHLLTHTSGMVSEAAHRRDAERESVGRPDPRLRESRRAF